MIERSKIVTGLQDDVDQAALETVLENDAECGD
jgi:hypothetical protein